MIYPYFLLFIIYSFIGWLIEVINSFVIEHKFVNRGFLMGPYCPIYGFGCLLLIILLSDYANEPLVLFALSIIVCSILEYFTSWLMEVIFKMRWWDYTNRKYNINGRICLETMVPFGLIGVLIVKYVNPFLVKILRTISPTTINILCAILACFFIIDIIISSNIVFNFKTYVRNSKKDATEDIKKHAKKVFKHNKLLYSRLINAFPNFKKIIIKKKKTKKKKKSK